MSSFNRCILMGNLTRDPELKYTPKGTAVVSTAIATNRTWEDETTGEKREEVCFLDLTIWGRQAEVVAEHFKCGSAILVEGRLQMDTWDDKTTGQKRQKHRLRVESFSFVGSAPQAKTPTPDGTSKPARQQQPGRGERLTPASTARGNDQGEDDDIPF